VDRGPDFGEIALGPLQAAGGRRANVQAHLTGVHFAIIGPDDADNGDVDFRKIPSAAPKPMRQMRIGDATIVYGRFNANATNHIKRSQLQRRSRPKPALASDAARIAVDRISATPRSMDQSSSVSVQLSLRIGASDS
jgi:hypothetical protein